MMNFRNDVVSASTTNNSNSGTATTADSNAYANPMTQLSSTRNGGCCVCSDERGWDENPLVYCDGQGCTVAVHQACYGIVTVPSGPWFCRKCESQERSARVRCELCPSRDGALKRTDSNGWAHVVCALYIPEVRFGNVTTMEPILISLIPSERFNKSCYICEDSTRGSKAAAGACMQCNKPGCKQNFHVTCAQMLGLLCEEAGNMMDNVKYCGYCQYHYGKLKKTSNMKIIPPFRPIPNSSQLGNNNGTESSSCPLVVLNKEHISPEGINNKSATIKKKVSGSSSSSSSSSKNSTNMQSSSTAAPRIAPSNLFSGNSSFSNSMAKSNNDRNDSSSTSSEQSLHKSVEDSFVLKSEDLKHNNNNSSSCNGDSNKFLKSSDFMTVKLNDVLTASLDRPIHESSHRDKSQPPDIKPHVTLTPIPMRSTDKLPEKASILFGQQGGSSMPKLKDSSQITNSSQENDKSLADISTTLFAGETKLALTSSKRTRMSMDFDSSATPDTQTVQQSTDSNSNRIVNTDYGIAPSNWDVVKQPSQQATITRANSDDRAVVLASPNNPGSSEDVNASPTDSSQAPSQVQVPIKRGPGRPVKRKAVIEREDERIQENHELRKKSKRGGRRGGNSGSYNQREEFPDVTVVDDDSNSKKVTGSGRKQSVPMPKKAEEPPTPTLSQLKAQMEANKSEIVSTTIIPAHMFGNALNPASSMAQRMVDTLSQEMETIAAAGVVGLGEKVEKVSDKLVGIPLPKFSSTTPQVATSSSVPAQSAGGPTQTTPPQTLEQLLERQWEQGSQFLMEQAQHLDIAQLLSCLNQLKQDNRALEEHVASLLQRKEQLTAINARLSIPLGSSLSISGSVAGGPNHPLEDSRAPESSGSQQHRGNQGTAEVVVVNPQQQQQHLVPNRSMNFTGLPVPVVVTAHHSPHSLQGSHGNR